MNPISFYSTNRSAPEVSFREALLRGQAPDRGLYLPDRIPVIPPEAWTHLAGASYGEVAEAIITPYVEGFVSTSELKEIIDAAYNFPVPLETAWPGRYILRLDRGPTLSFKDFAARLMARLMARAVQENNQELVILTATSGDTGGAVANAFFNLDNISVTVLFPRTEITARQRLQMTTLGGNIRAIEIDGKFDDCQRLVKDAFADPDLTDAPLTSANSINFGRLAPQAVYYAYTYTTLLAEHGPERASHIVFSVPCGNFGNICGGLIAHRMGMPVKIFIAATNENDEFPIYRETGVYNKIDPSRKCISSAMNVGHPSNLARIVDLYGGQLDHTGRMIRQADMAALKRKIQSVRVDDETSRRVMREAYKRHNILLEPHGSVSWHALDLLRGTGPGARNELHVSLETAHPAKFPEELRNVTGGDIPIPEALARLQEKPERYDRLPPRYEAFKTYLREEIVNG